MTVHTTTCDFVRRKVDFLSETIKLQLSNNDFSGLCLSALWNHMPRCMGESLNKCHDGPQEWVGEEATTSKKNSVERRDLLFCSNNEKLADHELCPWHPHSFQNATRKRGLLLMWCASNTKQECTCILYQGHHGRLMFFWPIRFLAVFFFLLRPQSPDLANTLGVPVLSVWGRLYKQGDTKETGWNRHSEAWN